MGCSRGSRRKLGLGLCVVLALLLAAAPVAAMPVDLRTVLRGQGSVSYELIASNLGLLHGSKCLFLILDSDAAGASGCVPLRGPRAGLAGYGSTCTRGRLLLWGEVAAGVRGVFATTRAGTVIPARLGSLPGRWHSGQRVWVVAATAGQQLSSVQAVDDKHQLLAVHTFADKGPHCAEPLVRVRRRLSHHRTFRLSIVPSRGVGNTPNLCITLAVGEGFGVSCNPASPASVHGLIITESGSGGCGTGPLIWVAVTTSAVRAVQLVPNRGHALRAQPVPVRRDPAWPIHVYTGVLRSDQSIRALRLRTRHGLRTIQEGPDLCPPRAPS